MKSTAVLAAFVSTAAAASAVVPTGISDGCSAFLTKLDSANTLTDCTTAITTATSAFKWGADGKPASSGTVSTALNNLCSSATLNKCSTGALSGTLTDFYAACSNELSTNRNEQVVKMYDVLYTIAPMANAACTKDDSGAYCLTKPTGVKSGNLVSGMPVNDVQKYLGDSSVKYTSPNSTTIVNSGLPFLFVSSSMDNADLCTTCTRNIMLAYASHESTVAYGPGLASSSLLKNQAELWNGVENTCGAGFLAVQAAGGIGSGIGQKKSGAGKVVASCLGMAGAAIAGAVFLL